jgi:DNA ligase-associated metallophosphoesterase
MNKNAKAINFKHQRLWLLPQKAIYWPKRKTLLLADLHIGKSGHFRKHGIAVPDQVNQSNLTNLSQLLDTTSAEHLIILGDLFHSDINKEWQQFVEWRKQYEQLEVSLVIGNHDILDKKNYHKSVINLFKKMTVDPFLLVHDLNQIDSTASQQKYILSGHIHPAVQLKGQGRQAMKLPCFYFGQKYGILPAFGGFTGTCVIEPNHDDRIYMIVDSHVISAETMKT